MQIHKAWLLPLRKFVEKWASHIPTKDVSEELMHTLDEMADHQEAVKLLKWRILLGHLDRIDEVTGEFLSR
jgi:hypothetical protein